MPGDISIQLLIMSSIHRPNAMNTKKNYFYFLSQVELLCWANNRWGYSQAGLMKFTPYDKLHLMGIVLGIEELKDFAGDLRKATKVGNFRNLDGSNFQ